MFKHKPSQWAGVFSNNVNAQDWWIKNNETAGSVDIATISTGGVTDIFVIIGSSPDYVVSQYYKIVGYPVLQPNWALGWH
jgi:alpha-glucosidase (family GH31 glycosyl hydrolase)